MYSKSYTPRKAKTAYNLGWRGYNKKIADQYGRNKSRPTHLIHVRKKSPNYTRLTSGTSDNNEAIYNAVAADAPRKNGMSVST